MNAIRTRRHAVVGLCGFLLLLLAGCKSLQKGHEPVTLRVMTYNMHHGEGLDGKVDLQRIADLIRREQADIVALQEVDKGTQRTDQRNFPTELATLTGLTCIFSNNYSFQGGEYGNALLTRFPVQTWTNTHLTRVTPGEQRGLLQAVVRVQGRELVVMDTHLDNVSDAERLLSAGQIIGIVESYRERPLVLCGDFNAQAGSSTYQKLRSRLADAWKLAGEGEGNTIPAKAPRQRSDYIWVGQTNLLRAVRAWVPKSEASDHLPVVAELKLHRR